MNIYWVLWIMTVALAITAAMIETIGDAKPGQKLKDGITMLCYGGSIAGILTIIGVALSKIH